MPGVLQVHIGDQHASRDVGDSTVPHLDWLDGSVMTVWDEFRALIAAAEILMASLQHPERGAAFDYPQFARLRSEWFAIRRNVTSVGAIGQNTITPTSTQLEDLFTSWTNKTSGNPARQQITRAKYATYNPNQWGLETDRAKYLYLEMDRDLTQDEVNTWAGKHSPAETDPVVAEHNPRWVDYEALADAGDVMQRTRVTDTPGPGTKADIRATNRIIDVVPQVDTIVLVRNRLANGDVDAANRIDDRPVRRGRL